MCSDMLHRRRSFAICVGVLVAASATASVAAPAPRPASAQPPIRVVRVGHANVAAFKENIKTSSVACRLVKNLPAVEPKLPSDDYLAKLAIFEDEQLFDGAKWAHYETQRSVAADATAGCALRLFVARAARIEDTCTSTVIAATPLMGELVDLEHPSTEAPSFMQEADERSCNQKAKSLDLTGLPRIDAGHGVQCVWYAAVIARAMAKAGLASSPSSATDFCVYAKLPEYVYRGISRQVVVKIKASTISQTGFDIATAFGEVAATSQELTDFSDGTAIPASRFTAAAAKAFVAQPTRTGL